MPISISNAYIETFEANVRHLAQQSDTRLRSHITETGKQSEKHNWDRLAASAARKKVGPRQASPMGGDKNGAYGSTDGLDWSRRVSIAETWDTGEVVEIEDPRQMIIDPNSAVTHNLAMNMRRAVDDLIIKAATGVAKDGAGADQTFPTAQVIGDGTGIINLDMILETAEKFYKNDVDPDEAKVFIIGPTQQRKMMQLLEVTSADYQSMKALSTGKLPNFMGFTWIVSNRLEVPASGQLNCLAFTKKALGMHVAHDIAAKIAERPDMSFAWQFYCVMTMGCVRVEDEHIVSVIVKDTIA